MNLIFIIAAGIVIGVVALLLLPLMLAFVTWLFCFIASLIAECIEYVAKGFQR